MWKEPRLKEKFYGYLAFDLLKPTDAAVPQASAAESTGKALQRHSTRVKSEASEIQKKLSPGNGASVEEEIRLLYAKLCTLSDMA